MGTAPNVCVFLKIETTQLRGKKQNFLLQQNAYSNGMWQQAQYRPTSHQTILLVFMAHIFPPAFLSHAFWYQKVGQAPESCLSVRAPIHL